MRQAATEGALDGLNINLRVPYPSVVAPAGYRVRLLHGHWYRDDQRAPYTGPVLPLPTLTGKCCSGRSLTWTPRPHLLPGSIAAITVQSPYLLLPCSDCAESSGLEGPGSNRRRPESAARALPASTRAAFPLYAITASAWARGTEDAHPRPVILHDERCPQIGCAAIDLPARLRLPTHPAS